MTAPVSNFVSDFVPSADATYAELWTSFASLLESYAAAHALNGNTRASVEVRPGCFVVRVHDRWVEVTHHGGAGIWKREDGRSAPIDLQLDGRVAVGEGFEEMDALAESLARAINV